MSKKIALACLFLLVLAGTIFVFKTNIILAQDYGLNETVQEQDYGLNETVQEIDAFKDQNPQTDINFIQTKTGQIIGTALSFVGILFLILVIYAGIMWMTAQGNEQKVTKAKDLLINSIIGLIIVFAAYAITAFVGEFVTKNILG